VADKDAMNRVLEWATKELHKTEEGSGEVIPAPDAVVVTEIGLGFAVTENFTRPTPGVLFKGFRQRSNEPFEEVLVFPDDYIVQTITDLLAVYGPTFQEELTEAFHKAMKENNDGRE
jgi:hypothetical protein